MRKVHLIAAVVACAALPIALAAAATAPAVTTSPATNVSASGATLAGTVNPEGQATVYAFQWGPTASYGHETPLPPASAGSGTTDQNVSATLSSLDAGTTYHVRIIAISSAGTTVGSDQTFATTGTPPAASTPPAATTTAASKVAQSSATLNGSVNPQAQVTSYYFEWGTTANYGFETSATNAGAGSAAVTATADLSGLVSSTTYHYRLVAVSPGGTALGSDQTFTTTTPPTVTTGQATDIQQTSATLTGTVNPQGQLTSDHFQYGTTTAYGFETPPSNAGSNSANVTVTKRVAALNSTTTYHYRLVAVSPGGTSYGSDQTLKTAGPTVASSTLHLYGHTSFVSPQGVIGVFVACIGASACNGKLTITSNNSVIGQRASFHLNANDGGFVHLQLNSAGQQLLSNHRHVLTQVTVTSTAGSTDTKFLTMVPFS